MDMSAQGSLNQGCYDSTSSQINQESGDLPFPGKKPEPNYEVARGLHTLHGFYDRQEGDSFIFGNIKSEPWRPCRGAPGGQWPIETKAELEALIHAKTGATSFKVDEWIGHTYCLLDLKHRVLIPDVVFQLNLAGINVVLKTKLEPMYHASLTPQLVSVEVSELKFLCSKYGTLLGSMSFDKEAKRKLQREVKSHAYHCHLTTDRNYFSSVSGRYFCDRFCEHIKDDTKEYWFPDKSQNLKGDDSLFDPVLDFPPPTLAYKDPLGWQERFTEKENEERAYWEKYEAATDAGASSFASYTELCKKRKLDATTSGDNDIVSHKPS